MIAAARFSVQQSLTLITDACSCINFRQNYALFFEYYKVMSIEMGINTYSHKMRYKSVLINFWKACVEESLGLPNVAIGLFPTKLEPIHSTNTLVSEASLSKKLKKESRYYRVEVQRCYG